MIVEGERGRRIRERSGGREGMSDRLVNGRRRAVVVEHSGGGCLGESNSGNRRRWYGCGGRTGRG